MLQKHLRANLGIGIATVFALLVGIFFLLEHTIASRLPSQVCVPSYAAGLICYAQPQSLSHQQATTIAISPDGKTLASSNRRLIQVWNLETEKQIRTLTGHKDWVSAIAISPNGQILASSSLDRTIKFWSLQTGALLGSIYAGRVTCLAFSPDGQTIASGSRMLRWPDGATSQGGVEFWDVATREWIKGFGSQPVTALAFSPDGKLIAMGSKQAEVWQLRNQQLLYSINSGDLTSLLFSRDGETLFTGSSKTKLWHLNSGKLLHSFSGASTLALSPDGVLLAAAAGGTVQLWDLETKDFLGMLRGSWYSGLTVEFALDGQAIVSSSSDGIKIWRSRPK